MTDRCQQDRLQHPHPNLVKLHDPNHQFVENRCLCSMQIGKLDAASTIANDLLLDLHNELSYNPKPVMKLMLLCLKAADEGGENLLARNADVTKFLSPSTLQRFYVKDGVR